MYVEKTDIYNSRFLSSFGQNPVQKVCEMLSFLCVLSTHRNILFSIGNGGCECVCIERDTDKDR